MLPLSLTDFPYAKGLIMGTSYIPANLSSYSVWMSNLRAKVNAGPATYGLSAGDAAAIDAAYTAFEAAYAISTSNDSRTPVAVQATQTARNSLSALVRAYSRIILANGGVLDADKLALGLVIRDTHPTAIPAPGTSPVVALVGATPGEFTLTFRDQGSSLKSRAKPHGVTSLELHILYGTTAPATPASTPYFRDETRSPFAVTNPSGSVGMTAFIYGRWKNMKGETGPWSTMLTTTCI